MKKIKKVLLCFMLVFTSLFFLGCSKVNLLVSLNANGKITSRLEINLDGVTEHKKTLYNIFYEYNKQLNTAYKENLVYYFSYIYDFEALNVSDEHSKFEYIVSHNPNYSAGESGVYPKFYDSNVKVLSIEKEFASIYAYLMYFCPSIFTYDAETNKIKISSEYHSLIDVPMTNADGEIEETGNVFVKNYIQDFCPFYYNNKEPAFLYDAIIMNPAEVNAGEKLVDVVKRLCGFEDEEVEYYFSFLTPYKRLHSSGETRITNSGYEHTWSLGSINSKVEVWRSYASYAPWYVFAIAISSIGLVATLIVIRQINKNKKKNGLKMLQKIDDFQNNKK